MSLSSGQQHPLQHRWTLWYLKNDKHRSWNDNLYKVIKVESVESFWSLYNHIKTPSELSVGCEYSFFKESIEPKWEHKANKKGGKWFIQFKRQDPKSMNQAWMELLLALIGESLGGDGVNGVVVQMKRDFARINLWLGMSEKGKVLDLGKRMKRILGVQEAISFVNHAEAQQRTSSKVKVDYVV